MKLNRPDMNYTDAEIDEKYRLFCLKRDRGEQDRANQGVTELPKGFRGPLAGSYASDDPGAHSSFMEDPLNEG